MKTKGYRKVIATFIMGAARGLSHVNTGAGAKVIASSL